jgi:hypothetical protein
VLATQRTFTEEIRVRLISLRSSSNHAICALVQTNVVFLPQQSSLITCDNPWKPNRKGKVKLSLWQAVEAHKCVRFQGYHIFKTLGSQMAVKLSALFSGRSLPPGRYLVLISVRVWVDPRDTVWLEVLGQLKNLMTSLRIEPATFRPNKLRYRVPP